MVGKESRSNQNIIPSLKKWAVFDIWNSWVWTTAVPFNSPLLLQLHRIESSDGESRTLAYREVPYKFEVFVIPWHGMARYEIIWILDVSIMWGIQFTNAGARAPSTGFWMAPMLSTKVQVFWCSICVDSHKMSAEMGLPKKHRHIRIGEIVGMNLRSTEQAFCLGYLTDRQMVDA